MKKVLGFFSKPSVQWTALFLVLAVVFYVAFKPEIKSFLNKRKGKEDGSNKIAIDPVTGATNVNFATSLKIDTKKQLKRRSEGNEVIVLQQLINETGYKPRLSEDGIYGIKTHDAVMSLMGSAILSVSISDFIIWRNKSLVPGSTLPQNRGINPNWWLSIVTP